MHNSESVLENETHKVFGDFKIQTDLYNLGQMTKPCDRQKKNKTKQNKKTRKKENLSNSGFCSADRQQDEK